VETREALRALRLWSGVVLFTYVTTHLLNHTLGLISLGAMEQGSVWFKLLWRSPPATVALVSAFILHVSLVFWSFYRRRSLKLSANEWAQIVMGAAIIPLGAVHIVGTRVAHEMVELNDSYTYVLSALWSDWPLGVVKQFGLVIAAWAHGCYGLHVLWRLKPGYRRIQPILFAGALLLPVLALIAFFQRGAEIAHLMHDRDWLQALATNANFPMPDERRPFVAIRVTVERGIGVLLQARMAARLLRGVWERRHGLVKLRYPDDAVASGPAGPSILEFSRRAGIPHASVCGGRGRCSTCRVRVGRGREHLPPPTAAEQKVLARIGMPANVRLACQVHPVPGDYDVTPLLPAAATAREGFARGGHHHGQEREIAVLFADIRGFTTMAEHQLPYDTVFVLNRYFRAMGEAIDRAGGHVDKFIGDGVMALFGLEGDKHVAARQAIDAARRMALALDQLNESLSGDLDAPLRIGIGVHIGTAIVGELGYGASRALTAIGDMVNTASRLEALTKEYQCEVILSDDLIATAGIDIGDWPSHEISVRGRSGALVVRAIADGAFLPEPPAAGQPSRPPARRPAAAKA
jgi:adenylate cyclase